MSSLLNRLRSDVPTTPITSGLILIIIIVFIAMVLAGAGLLHENTTIPLQWGANFGPATQDGQWWRLGSAMFLHFGVIHLVFNSWALWDGGQWAERMYGHGRFALIFLLSGLLGNLASLVYHQGQVVSGGASGAIFGVYGSLISFLWASRGSVGLPEFRFLFFGASLFILLSLLVGFVVEGIDNAAHIGGGLTGLLAGFLLLPNVNSTAKRKIMGGLMLAGYCAALVIKIPEPRYLWSEELLLRAEISEFLLKDEQVSQEWSSLVQPDNLVSSSFDALAGQLEQEVVQHYEDSFEQLSSLPHNSHLPSAGTLETLEAYVEKRRVLSREMAESLKTRDQWRWKRAVEDASNTPVLEE